MPIPVFMAKLKPEQTKIENVVSVYVLSLVVFSVSREKSGVFY